MMEEFT